MVACDGVKAEEHGHINCMVKDIHMLVRICNSKCEAKVRRDGAVGGGGAEGVDSGRGEGYRRIFGFIDQVERQSDD